MTQAEVSKVWKLPLLNVFTETYRRFWMYKSQVLLLSAIAILIYWLADLATDSIRNLGPVDSDKNTNAAFWVALLLEKTVHLVCFSVIGAYFSRKIYLEGRQITLGPFPKSVFRYFLAGVALALLFLLLGLPFMLMFLFGFIGLNELIAPNSDPSDFQVYFYVLTGTVVSVWLLSRFILIPAAAAIYDGGGWRAGLDAARDNMSRLFVGSLLVGGSWLVFSIAFLYAFSFLVGIDSSFLDLKRMLDISQDGLVTEYPLREAVVLGWIQGYLSLIGGILSIFYSAVCYRRLARDQFA